MEFLNKSVISKTYGLGTVISVDDSIIKIQFFNDMKSFNYMIAFRNKALFFADENDQKEIDALFAAMEAQKLEEEKKAAEIKEKREKEEAQKRKIKEKLLLDIDEAILGDGIKLIGDYEFSKDNLDSLSELFINKYNLSNESVSRLSEDDIKCFLIVMINKLRDYDKPWNEFPELLSSFFDHLSLFDTQSKITNLYNRVAKIFEANKRILFITNSGKRAFEQTFLYQALAPKDSIQSFVKLAWSLYLDEDILDSDYSNSDPDLCLRVIQELNKKFDGLNNEDDSIQFSGASYGIRAGLKYGCEQNKEKTAELLNRIFDYIHRVDHYSEEITDNYLGTVVTDVVTNLKKIVVTEHKKSERQFTNGYCHSFEQARPTFYLDTDQLENPRVLLCYPKVILLDFDDELLSATVELYKHFKDGKDPQKFHIHPQQIIKRNDTCQTLRSFSIDITNDLTSFADDFRIEAVLIVRGNNGVYRYSSESSLYRDFIVFKENHEIKGTSRPGTFCLICPREFSTSKNLKLFNKDWRRILNGIYYFTSKELDLIEYGNTCFLFGSNAQSANVLFAKEEMKELESVLYIPDPENKDNGVPVYTSLSDIFIENENAVTPSSIRITHKTYDDSDGSIAEDVKSLSDLEMVDRRYCYSAINNYLTEPGWHSLEIVKLTAGGAKSMLNSPKFDYFFDSQASIKCRELAYLKNQVKLTLKLFGVKYSAPVNYSQQVVMVDTGNGLFRIIPPYFRWKFGFESEFKNKPLETPLFIDDIPSSSVLIIDSTIEVEGLFFLPENENKEYAVDRSNQSENTFLISQFLAANYKKGKFLAKTTDYGVLPVFNVEISPYFKESNIELEFNDGKLKYDFSKAFFHDKKDYKLKLLIGTEEFDEPIVLDNLNAESESETYIEDLEDDNYTIELYYYSEYSGIRSKDTKILLNNDYFMFGDIVKASFNSIDEIIFDKCCTSQGNKKIKDNVITNIRYLFSDGENRLYEGILSTPFSKRNKVIFYADKPNMIRKVFFVFGANSEIRKEANFDISRSCIVSNEPSEGKIYHMSSIYIKR